MAAHLDEENLWALAAGENAGDAAATAHLGSCDACRGRVEQMRSVRSVAQHARAPEPSVTARNLALHRVEAALARESQRRVWWWDRRSLLLPALGMAAAVGAGVALMVGQPESTPVWPPAGAPPLSARLAEDAPAPSAMPVNPSLAEALPSGPAPVDPAANPAGAQPVARPAGRTGRAPVRRSTDAPAAPATVAAEVPVPPEALPARSAEPGTQVAVLEARTEVDVEPRVPFPRLEAARARVQSGRPLEGLEVALALLDDAPLEERAAAMQLVREVALGTPSADVVQRLSAAAVSQGDAGEALAYLACESSVLGRRPKEAVQGCRAFVARFPQSVRARDASYMAGTLSRDRLGDCAGAVEDYSRALVFTGPLGNLNDEALFWRAHCRAELGQREAAREDLQQFLTRYPSRRVDPQVRALQTRLR